MLLNMEREYEDNLKQAKEQLSTLNDEKTYLQNKGNHLKNKSIKLDSERSCAKTDMNQLDQEIKMLNSKVKDKQSELSQMVTAAADARTKSLQTEICLREEQLAYARFQLAPSEEDCNHPYSPRVPSQNALNSEVRIQTISAEHETKVRLRQETKEACHAAEDCIGKLKQELKGIFKRRNQAKNNQEAAEDKLKPLQIEIDACDSKLDALLKRICHYTLASRHWERKLLQTQVLIKLNRMKELDLEELNDSTLNGANLMLVPSQANPAI